MTKKQSQYSNHHAKSTGGHDMNAEQRLQAAGIILPSASMPAANYTNYVLINGLLFVAGKGPTGNALGVSVGATKPSGKLGGTYSIEDGYQFARQAGVEVLAVVKAALGSLDNVKQVVKIQGFVNAEPHFDQHHKVLDGCSDLMVEVFGDKGIHARSVLGATSLRDNLPIIIDAIFAAEI
jgi:enamine deaminase RidA (YjgF/YER057c/UK114 family)